jgi:hypothetical protein
MNNTHYDTHKYINDNHKYIYEKLDSFINSGKIPNLLFHGSSGVGKKTILQSFLTKLYETQDNIQKNVLSVNCSHEKGIKFIREDLKFFSRANLFGNHFKSVVLLNAEQLTADAQSALRRCIELFSNNTRFFIVVENQEQILKPILSRFCDIYIPNPIINNKEDNYYKLHNNTINIDEETKRYRKLDRLLRNTVNPNIQELVILTNKLYSDSYSCLDLMKYINKIKIVEKEKHLLLIYFNKIRKQYRNEKLLILKILYFIYMRNDSDLENILDI